MKNEKIKVFPTIYINGISLKFDNRRVQVTETTEKELYVCIKRLLTKEEAANIPESEKANVIGGKIYRTHFILSIEAAEVLYAALGHRLSIISNKQP